MDQSQHVASTTADRSKVDVCVIGAGSGGLSVAAGAAQMGARVVLIEGHRMGGDCLNYGCVPSKTLLSAARAAHARTIGGDRGIRTAAPEVDYAATKDAIDRVVAAIAPHDSQARFEELGVDVVRDYARFVSETEVTAGGRIIQARRFVIATGSTPVVPDVPGIGDVDVHTNETIFDLRVRPDHLLILGGGPVGIEMAQAHRRLGARVTVIEAGRALGKEDPEAAAVVLHALRAEGVEIVENVPATRVTRDGDGVAVDTDAGRYSGTHLLVAAGRSTTLDRLDLGAANVAHGAGVTVGPDLRSTTNAAVFAVGDAAGDLQFTHAASYHAGIVLRRALFGLPARAGRDHIPRVTYTDPELAHVGLTETAARDRYGASQIDVVRADFADNDRAVVEGRTEGFAKVVVRGGKPVGVTIVGAEAGELIAVWALAIASGLKMSAVSNMVAPYPTLGEINKRVAGAYYTPKLFGSPWVKRVVRAIQTVLP